MTATDLPARCLAEGVHLVAGPDGALTWEAATDPPAELLADLAAHKAELLALLPGAGTSTPSWDADAADRLLAELRAEVQRSRARAGLLAENLGAALERVLADALALGEGYVREQGAEAARGWDALELLRGLPAYVRQCAVHARQLAAAEER